MLTGIKKQLKNGNPKCFDKSALFLQRASEFFV